MLRIFNFGSTDPAPAPCGAPLAEKAKLSPVCIRRVECGKANISVDAAMRIANAVGVFHLVLRIFD